METVTTVELRKPTLKEYWETAGTEEDAPFFIDVSLLYHISKDERVETVTQIAVPRDFRRWILEKAHKIPLAGHLGTL